MTTNKLSNRLLAMVMVISMMVSMFAGLTFTASAEVGTPATEIWFAGATLNAETPYALQIMRNTNEANGGIEASATPDVADPASRKLLATFDAATGTLTYNSGYALTALGGTVEPEPTWNTYTTMQLMDGTNTKYGIKADGDLVVDLNGYTNGLWLDWNENVKDVNTTGIDVNGNLTITDSKGDGYLRITAIAPYDVDNDYDDPYTAYGVKATGDVNFDGGKVYFFERPFNTPQSGDTATFVYADGNINLSGGSVKMRGMKRSTWVTKFNVDPSYDANAYVVSDSSNLEIEGAANQTLGYVADMGAAYGNTNNATYTALNLGEDITPAAAATEVIYAGATLNESTPYLFITTTGNPRTVAASATPTPADASQALFAQFDPATGTLTYKTGFSYESRDTAYFPAITTYVRPVSIDTTAYGIKANGSLTIDLGSHKNAIKLLWNDLGHNMNVIDVAGQLTVKGNGGALELHAVNATDSSNGVTGGKYSGVHHTNGIRADGNVVFEGGEVYIYSRPYTNNMQNNDDTSTLINAGGKIKLEGGKLKMRTYSSAASLTELSNRNITVEGDYTTETNENENFDGTDVSYGYTYWTGTANAKNRTYIPNYTLSFEENGADEALDNVTAAYGETVDISSYQPTKDGYVFGGWYADKELSSKITSVTLNADTTIYAKWIALVGSATEVIYAGVTLNSETPYLVSWVVNGSGLQVRGQADDTLAEGESVLAYFDVNTGTLTYMSGMQLSTVTGGLEPDFGWNTYKDAVLIDGAYYGIKANGNLVVDLNGYNNFIGMNWNTLFASDLYGIYADGDITITGEGYLKLPATHAATTDTGSGGDNGTHYSYGIYASGGDVNLNSGTVTIYSKLYQRWEAGANANSIGVYADGNIGLNGTILKYRYEEATGSGIITHFNKTPNGIDNYRKDALTNVKIEGNDLKSLGFVSVDDTITNNNCFNYVPVYTLSFEGNGANETYSDITADRGETIDFSSNYPSHPKNWSFVGWYLDPECTQRQANTITMYADTTLYAHWAPPATEVFVGGVTLDAINKYLVATNAADNVQIKLSASAELPSDITRLIATFDEPTHTFTFNRGYTLVTEETNEGTKYTYYEPTFLYNSQIYAAIPEGESTQYGLKANGSIIIDLNGYSNMLYTHWTATTDGVGVANGNGARDYNVIGIYSAGNVDIVDSGNGKGYISISAHPSTNSADDSYTIWARGNINLNGGTVVAYEGMYTAPTNGAETVFFYADGNNRIRGAEVKIRTSSEGSAYTTVFNKTDEWLIESANTVVNDDKNIAVADLYFGTKTRGTTKYDASYNTNSVSYVPYVTLTFNSNGGSTFNSQKVIKYTEFDLTQYTPTLTGSTFGGWYTDAGLTKKADDAFIIYGDTTLYAKWSGNEHTITYINGSNSEEVKAVYGSTHTVKAAPEKAHYTFDGWYNGDTKVEGSFTVEGDVTLTAKWTPVKYTLTFVTEGSGVEAVTKDYNTVINLNEYTSTKAGYSFDGWFVDNEKVETITLDGNKTVTAKFSYIPKTFKLTYMDGEDVLEVVDITEFATVAVNKVVTKEHYTLDGWYAEGVKVTEIASVSGDITVNAKWTPVNYTITYVNGDSTETVTAAYGSTHTVKADPEKAHYTFDGWFNGDAKAEGSFTVEGDVTLTAKWTPVNYTLTYVDGEDTTTEEFVYNTDVTLEVPAAKTGWSFLGWYTEAEFTNAVTAVKLDSNKTVYAKWVENYTITYVVDGETHHTAKADKGTQIQLIDAPAKPGYTFDGWLDSTNNNNIATSPYTVASDVTFTASYTKDIVYYTFSYKVDGEVVETVTKAEGTVITLDRAAAKDGYRFAGWSVDGNITGSVTLNSDTVAVAEFVKQYTLTLKAEGAADITITDDVNKKIDLTAYAIAAKTGHTIDGWTLDGDIVTEVTLDADKEVVAKWTPINYTITYNVDGVETEETAAYGSTHTVKAAPEKAHYTFDGWFNEDDDKVEGSFTVEGNVTLTAKWTVVKYTLTFVTEGSEVEAVTEDYNTVINLNNYTTTKAGYSFDGWFVGGNKVETITLNSNKEVTAKFTYIPKTFKLTYMDGEDVLEVVDITEFTTVAVNKVVTKEHYTLDGWYADGVKVTEIASVSGDVTVNAKWTPVKYTLTFVTEGSSVDAVTEDYNTVINLNNYTTTKAGHSFDGWFVDDEKVETITLDGNKTVEAKFTYIPKTFKLTYMDGEDVLEVVDITEFTTVQVNKAVSKEHYTFDGWYADGVKVTEIANISGDVTVNAKWTPVNYTITYVNETTETVTATYGSTHTVKADPSKEHYTFDGWYNGDAKVEGSFTVEGNVTLTAKWTPVKYTLTFVTEGTSVESVTADYNTVIDLNEYTSSKDKHSFDGWFIGEEKVESITLDGNKSVEAKFTYIPGSYTLTFVTDGSAVAPVTMVEGSVINLNEYTSTKDGYSFDGWFVGDEKVETITLDGNKTVEAKFTYIPKTFKLTYMDGEDVLEVVDITECTTVQVNKAATKGHYTFDGWYADGVKVTEIASVSGDVTVNAKWTPVNYSIAYIIDETSEVITAAYGSTHTLKAAPSKEHYSFDGWFDGSVKIEGSFTVEGDVTLIAKWTPVNYTITYVNETSEEVTAAYASTHTVKAAPSKEHYSFEGWFNENGDKVEGSFTVEGDVTLTAKWTPVKYTLTFVTEGTSVESVTADYNTVIDLGEYTSSKDKHSFDGWFIDEEKVESVTLDGNKTVTAKFTKIIPTSFTVSGTATSFLDEAGTITIELFADGEATAAYTTTVTGNTVAYSITDIVPGTYTMVVSKENHAAREYIVTFTDDDAVQDVKICPMGDTNGDGEITTADAFLANAHAQRKTELNDYAIKCGDIMGTVGVVSRIDVARINAHVKGIKLLW